MDEPLKPFEELSRHVAETSDANADPTVIEAARRRALAGWKAKRRRLRAEAWAPRLAFAVAIAVAVVAVLVLSIRGAPRPALTYTVGDEAAPRPIGAWIAAGERDVLLRFSEGTVLTLGAQARARVTSADTDGAAVLLEQGALRANVVHRDASTRWSLHAGPFQVQVVGTELAVAWDPTKAEIELRVIEGRVVITGPLLDGGRPVTTGQRLRVFVKQQRLDLAIEGLEISPTTAATPTSSAAASPAAASPAATSPAATSSACPPPRCPPEGAPNGAPAGPSASATPPSWRELAAVGKHRAAMEAADREGFADVLARASTSDLVALADAARYAGDYGRARSALLRARNLGMRGRTAFLLGKIAADHLGAAADAITWFQTYLAEEPGGDLAEQALGRIVELKRRSGDAAGARAAAQTYLARYPSGAYAPLARLAVEP